MSDTIFALASARGKAGVAVIRISGPGAHGAVRALAGDLPPPRRASLRNLARDGKPIDSALVLVFEAGASFTGEPSAELQCHGSPAVVSALLSALGAMPGLRLAEAGEFTRRALENGRLDLAQVEGLADLVEAETEAQRRQAMRVLSGELGKAAEAWRSQLVRAAALLEATIDFADEEVPEDVTGEVRALLGEVIASLDAQLSAFRGAEIIREGFQVAIVGPPNAGKSTLLNRLAGRDAAITSEVAGTTRDVIEVRMDIGGFAVTLLDTAGLRDAVDTVERIGVERALSRAAAADLRVVLTGGAPLDPRLELGPEDIVVVGKSDVLPADGFALSGKTGEGVDALLGRIEEVLARRTAGAGLAIRERHRSAMERARAELSDALAVLDAGSGHELAAEEIRRALFSLDSLVGRVDVEHLLDEIFASFCIGK